MTQSKINLVHLSDIHFYEFDKANGKFDLNEDLRNELERDLERCIEAHDHIDGILVSGDIAYSGTTAEYAVAAQWLDHLTQIIGCPAQNVWTIPGNHDVHRPAIDDSLHTQDMHAKMRSVDEGAIDSQLLKYLGHKDGDALFAPIENYNTFAKRYGCTSIRTRPTWEHDLQLNDNSYLRLLGLNSAIISDSGDDKFTNRLVVGERQSKPLNLDGVTYLVMCHHPPDWLRDEDVVENNLISRATVQLFGHKHTLRHQKVENSGRECLVVAAGAVHPSRSESDWKPRYNIMSLWVVDNGSRSLEVTIWPRIYNESNQFVPDWNHGASKPFHVYSMKLSPWNGRVPKVRSTYEELIPPATLSASDNGDSVEASLQDKTMENERLLVYKFFSLSYSQSVRIAVELDLVQDGDGPLNEMEQLNNFYLRAKAAGKLADLWEHVDAIFPDGQKITNPFEQGGR